MNRSLSLSLCFAVASCVESGSADPNEIETEAANVTVAPNTNILANPPVGSGVRISLWRPGIDTGVAAFWPAGARTVQVIMTAGDPGDALTGFQPTTFVWIVKNGATIHKVWRVVTAQMTGAMGFRTRFDQWAATQAAAAPAGSDPATPIILGSSGTHGPRGPKIGPGGSGEFTQTMVKQVLVTAQEMSNFTDVTAKERPF